MKSGIPNSKYSSSPSIPNSPPPLLPLDPCLQSARGSKRLLQSLGVAESEAAEQSERESKFDKTKQQSHSYCAIHYPQVREHFMGHVGKMSGYHRGSLPHGVARADGQASVDEIALRCAIHSVQGRNFFLPPSPTSLPSFFPSPLPFSLHP